MSKTNRELEDMMNIRADFDEYLSLKKFRSARMMIEQMGESYSEFEALKMHQEYNRACSSVRPISQENAEYIDGKIYGATHA